MKMLFLLVLTIVILVVTLFAGVKNNTIPPNLGVNGGRLAELPDSPNAVSSQTDSAERKVEPLAFRGDLQETKQFFVFILKQLGAQIVAEEEEYLHAVFQTPVIPFKDDVELYFDRENAIIHYRSASRVGYYDFGVNRKRYETIRKLYDQQPL